MTPACQVVCQVGCRVLGVTRQRSDLWNQHVNCSLSGLSGFYERRGARRIISLANCACRMPHRQMQVAELVGLA
jgi:hypothetical protein